MRNGDDLEAISSLPIYDVIRKSTNRHSSGCADDARGANYTTDRWMIFDEPKNLLNLIPEFITKASSLTFVPTDRGAKLGLSVA